MGSDISEGWSACIQMDASKMHTGWVGGLYGKSSYHDEDSGSRGCCTERRKKVKETFC